MIRYHGQPYELSDDYANDMLRAEQDARDERVRRNVRCETCKWRKNGVCTLQKKEKEAHEWCSFFERKKARKRKMKE